MVRDSNGGNGFDLRREEVEQLARMQAERLLTPRERAIENTPERPPTRPPEPTIEERFAAIDRRAAEYAAEQRRALLSDYLDAARKRLDRAVALSSDPDVVRAAAAVVHAEWFAK